MSQNERTIRPAEQQINPLPVTASPELISSYAQMLGMIRDIRAEVQNLQGALQDVLSKSTLNNATMRAQEILTTVRANQPIYDYNGGQIEIRLGELRALMRSVPTLYDRYGDEIAHIENFWERATYEWPHIAAVQVVAGTDDAATAELSPEGLPTGEAAQVVADEVVRSAEKVNEYFHNLIYHAGVLTIPDRLNQHLEQLRIGQALDFNATFVDEVPRDADRLKILAYLSRRPMAVRNGIIDVENGVIFHASPSITRRRLSYVYILLTIVCGALLAYMFANAGDTFELEDWPVSSDSTSNLMIGYVAVIIGGIVHLGVDAIKQARGKDTRTTLLALDDWFVWVHINEVGIIIGIVSLWVGFFGLVLINGTINWQTAFLVGYSIDSFVDMFLERFNTDVSSRVAKIAV
ncbi:MAG: hypothetical protein OHK0046_44190 [Anaerolineae bacterium]